MKIIVIGGTGHIGAYLIPRLVKAGHEVICVSQKKSNPCDKQAIWKVVKHIIIDAQTFIHPHYSILLYNI